MGPSDAPKPTTNRASSYVPELDTFRAIAIASVMCIHWLPSTSLVNRLQSQISNGVHPFFVLSGYLITRILLQARAGMDAGTTTLGWSLRQFYARRALRIFPIYYFVLLVGVIFAFPGLRHDIWWHVAYLSNALYFHRHGVFDSPAGVFWTLSVEEQFYLLWPLAILLVPRRALIPFVATVAVLGTLCRDVAMFRYPTFNMLMPACVNFLATGALVAIVDDPTYGSPRAARRLRWIFLALTIGLLAPECVLFARRGLGYLAQAAAVRDINQTTLCMLYALLFAQASRGFPRWIALPLRFPPLMYLGRISYGLYVYHLFVESALERGAASRLADPIGRGLAGTLARNPLVLFTATVAVATASWYLLERPMNELKRYFPYTRRSKTAPARAGVVGSEVDSQVGAIGIESALPQGLIVTRASGPCVELGEA